MSPVHRHIVVAGPTGTGKTTVGTLLAGRLGIPFGEGDSFHAPEAVARMARGEPLTDADRLPWLDRVGSWLAGQEAAVVACSALTVAYRDVLRGHVPDLFVVLLEADEAVVRDRVEARPGHFMPGSLVRSQFELVEPLGPGEAGVTLASEEPVGVVVRAALAAVT